MAIRFDGAADTALRNAGLPSMAAGYAMCGWANQQVDRNAFSSICELAISATRTNGQLCLQTAADGVTFNLWYDSASISVQEPSTGYAAAVGVPFFWAAVVEGTGANQVKAYFRTRGSNAFNVAFSGTTGLGAVYTPTVLNFGNASTAEWWNGDIWNVKVWERAPTAKELLIESFYQRVMFPASLYGHYLLRNAADNLDYSGNARPLTMANVTTGAQLGNYGMWRPRRQYFIPYVAAGAPAIEGDLAATEAADVAAIAGEVDVSGDLVVTEAADVAAIAGEVDVSGDLAATEAADVAAISGEVEVTGDLSVVEGADTAAIAGEVEVAGDLAVTDAPDTAALAGEVEVSGDLAAVEQGDVAAISGGADVTGDMAATEDADVAALEGGVLVQGDLAVIEQGADTAAMDGAVLVSGDLAAIDEQDIAAINGTNDHFGDMAAIEQPDVAALSGGVLVQGDVAAIEQGQDVAAAAGSVLVSGDLAVTDAPDVAAISGALEQERIGDMAATDAPDSCSITGHVPQPQTVEPLPRQQVEYMTSEARRFGVFTGRFTNVKKQQTSTKYGTAPVTVVESVETSAHSRVPGQDPPV